MLIVQRFLLSAAQVQRRVVRTSWSEGEGRVGVAGSDVAPGNKIRVADADVVVVVADVNVVVVVAQLPRIRRRWWKVLVTGGGSVGVAGFIVARGVCGLVVVVVVAVFMVVVVVTVVEQVAQCMSYVVQMRQMKSAGFGFVSRVV